VKKLAFLALTFSVLTLGVPGLTHSRPRQSSQQDEKKPELVNIKGTVRADGNKITFVADDTGKAWEVINPETLKAHVGHHVSRDESDHAIAAVGPFNVAGAVNVIAGP
jgi:hypothetical protein